MIIRNEILQIASNKYLNPFVIEKDYVLGWLLAGISHNPTMSKLLVFKGGTCLKKCYFETYRSSEDLDFTVYKNSDISERLLQEEFSKIAVWISNNSGIEMPLEKIAFWSLINSGGNSSYQGKVHYRGPISPTSKYVIPKIKLDITIDEIIVDEPVLAKVNHEFSDIPISNIIILSYSYIEVFAEKIRALKERTRPRDLYDVISFYRRPESHDLASQVKHILKEKCFFKAIDFPKIDDVTIHKEKCEQGWKEQLEHQIPMLPSFASFWDELEDFFSWLNGNANKVLQPMPYVNDASKISLKAANIDEFHFNALNLVRFAAANHLCVEIDLINENSKKASSIILEPYSLRIFNDKIFLYGLESDKLIISIEAIDIQKIVKAKVINKVFKPYYQIEFLPEIIS